MMMTRPLRKFTLTVHLVVCVGWVGAVLAYLALAITALATTQIQTVRAAYPMMEVVGWTVLVPLALGSVITGLIQSLGTEWGLFRHYWIVAKLALTAIATTILLTHMPAVKELSVLATQSTASIATLGQRPVQDLVHVTGGLTVLLGITALSVYKPWGRTAYGRKRLAELVSRGVSDSHVI